MSATPVSFTTYVFCGKLRASQGYDRDAWLLRLQPLGILPRLMGRITFTSNLQRHVSCPPVRIEGRTVREVLDRVFEDNPLLRSYILDDQGRLRRHVNVFLNDNAVTDRDRLTDAVGPDDDIYVFQALSGG